MSTSQKRKELNILHNIENNVFRNKKWQCMHPDCTEHAINSHLLQRHGLLDNLTNDGHLYEIKYVNPNYWMNNPIRFEFKRIGINDAISRPIFCKYHDNILFKKTIQAYQINPDLKLSSVPSSTYNIPIL